MNTCVFYRFGVSLGLVGIYIYIYITLYCTIHITWTLKREGARLRECGMGIRCCQRPKQHSKGHQTPDFFAHLALQGLCCSTCILLTQIYRPALLTDHQGTEWAKRSLCFFGASWNRVQNTPTHQKIRKRVWVCRSCPRSFRGALSFSHPPYLKPPESHARLQRIGRILNMLSLLCGCFIWVVFRINPFFFHLTGFWMTILGSGVSNLSWFYSPDCGAKWKKLQGLRHWQPN